MPKKLKASTSGIADDQEDNFDSFRYSSREAWCWSNTIYKQKPIIDERGLKINEGWDNNMLQIIYDRDWEKFIEVPPCAVEAVVREFYSNLMHARQNKCKVRGKLVPFGPKVINAYYGTPDILDDDWHPYFATENVDVDEITRVLCYGEVEWEMTRAGAYKLFKVGLLNADAKAWYAFVATRLYPVKHISDVTLDRAKLVHAIMSGKTIDIGRWIYSRLMCTVTTTSTGIWFPSLVTALCRQAGVVISAEETERPPLQPIERVSQSRYVYREDAQDRVHRVERTFWNPSPPHGNPGVARKGYASSSSRRPSRVTIEDKLDTIHAQLVRHEEFHRYQYDWQQQMQHHMTQLSLQQGMSQDVIPSYPDLRHDYFHAPMDMEHDPAGDEGEDIQQGDWPIPEQGDSHAAVSSSWQPWSDQPDEE